MTAKQPRLALAASDGPDPIRSGEDHTVPVAGELTTVERLRLEFSYPNPIALGKPFAAGLKWQYTRVTTGASHTYSADDTKTNLHVLNRYVINAPNVVRRYKREPWIIQAQFFGPDDYQFRGDDLFVQCLLVGPYGQYRYFTMQDDGIPPDGEPRDGIYPANTSLPWRRNSLMASGCSSSSRRTSTPRNPA